MEGSTTYQAIFQKGFALGQRRQARRAILIVGTHRFGPQSKEVVDALEAIDDLPLLERLSIRAMHVGSWSEVLSTIPSDCPEGS